MKISYKTHPALEKLKNGTLGVAAVPYDGVVARQQSPAMFYDLNQVFKKQVSKLRGNIFNVSTPFFRAAEKAFPRLSSLYSEMLGTTSEFAESKVFILNDFVIFFVNKFTKDEDSFEVFYLLTDKEGVIMEFYFSGKDFESEVNGWSSILMQHGPLDNQDDLRIYLQTRMLNLSSLCMFIKYAEVETKLVLGKSKRRFGDPYRNDTDFTITHLDSKWFRNIVRSEGFAVRGHFRLQPKKVNGEWTKELIWIADFEKHGYTSKAKILNVE